MAVQIGIVDQVMVHAKELHQTGQLSRAAQFYRQVLESCPQHAEAMHQLGLLTHQLGDPAAAVPLMEKAIALDASVVRFHNNLAAVYRASGDLDRAVVAMRRAVGLQPESPQLHRRLGILLQEQGGVAEAQAHQTQSQQLEPQAAKRHYRRGNQFYQQRRLREAIKHYQRALAVDPRFVSARNTLGVVYRQLGEVEQAEASFKQALRLNPNSVAVHNNYANLLHDLHRLPEAVRHYRKAVELKPAYAPGYTNLGMALRDQNKLDEAIAQIRKTIELDPSYVDAYDRLAMVLRRQCKMDEARNWSLKAETMAPSIGRRLVLALALPMISASKRQMHTDRKRLHKDVQALLVEEFPSLSDPLVQAGITNFCLAYQGLNDCRIQADVARLYVKAAPGLRYIAPHCSIQPDANPDRRIRVGFASSCFYDHTIGKLNAGYIRHLSRDRFHVTVFQPLRPRDKWQDLIRDSADGAVSLPRHFERARQQIAQQRLDVLFYTDIGMDPLTFLLAFARLAPVQCVSWGHPITTGIDTVDYFLSSVDLESRGARNHYSETLVRFKHPPTYYLAPALSSPPRSRRHFGLDETAHLYLCPQTLFKLHPDFDSLLGRILKADPAGELVLIEPKVPQWKGQWMRRFRRRNPNVAPRIRFLPRQSTKNFLHLINMSDVLLDPLHFGGGNTTYEALAVGTPIVTLPGRFMRGRVTYACYRQMGVTDAVAEDQDQYVALAVQLATDPGHRQAVRAKILDNNHALYENRSAIKELEQFLVDAVGNAHN